MTELSIVIPMRNEAARFCGCIERVVPLIERHHAEVILVVNGCTDNTAKMASETAWEYQPAMRWIQSAPGKGAAVKAGVLAASGKYILVSDCDWSVGPDAIETCVDKRDIADIIIADRELPASVRLGEPWRRHLSGRVFNLLTQAALPELRGMRDTQCGFKWFRAPVARGLFKAATITGWAWDIEVLYLARRLGLRIAHLPVIWQHDGHSQVHLVRDAMQMLREVAQIRRNQRAGAYKFGGYPLDVISEV